MEEILTNNYGSNSVEKIGVEIEFLLVDKNTFDLADRVHPLMERIGEDPCLGYEAFQSCIEVKTTPVHNVQEAEKEIQETLQKIKGHLDPLNLRLCSLGVHPFNKGISKTTNTERYIAFEKEYPYITHHHLNFSTHVHVSMGSFEEALRVMNSMRSLLPIFIALSASGPFWQAEETGFVSFRQYLLKGNFNGGIPPHFEDKKSFYDFFKAAKKSGAINTIRDIHWDIRPRPDLGTVELRIMDAVPTVREAMALSTLAHASMRALKTQSLSKFMPTVFEDLPPQWAEGVNYSQASYKGIKAPYIYNSLGETYTLEHMANMLLDAVEKTAQEIGGSDDINQIRSMLGEGLVYQQINQIYKDTDSLKEVVRYASEKLSHEIGLQ